MATKYNLTTAFTAITETSGTIQNVGKEAVELASSTNAVEGEGIVLNPSEKRSFKGALSARSMGDAGAVVNVVDFTEAGEGGEEYVLPIASDTELGGIKISNSFTVANDGTLSIKKSGKTILGAVKSSDDEGKVAVNNDGTMTYNPWGYRQPSTSYTAGQIAYHSALPTGYYLECTTAGTTSAGDITPSSTIGDTVTDGTVTWRIQTSQNEVLLPLDNSVTIPQNANLDDYQTYGVYLCNSGSIAATLQNTPYISGGFKLITLKNDGSIADGNWWGSQILITASENDQIFIRSHDRATWKSWRQQEAIIAKSLGTNGYIKYASGLIIQWGEKIPTQANTTIDVNFPVSFTTTYVVTGHAQSQNLSNYVACQKFSTSMFKILVPTSLPTFTWIAIGY